MTEDNSLPIAKDFFSPKTFYTLSGSAFGVWIVCVVVNTLFPQISSFYFRIIAFGLSQLIAIIAVARNNSQRKQLQYWFLSFFNAALIFVHASGFNAVTYNLSFEKGLKYDSTSFVKSGLLNLDEQQNWWPDHKLLEDKKQLQEKNFYLQNRNLNLNNQFSFIRDWTYSNIKNSTDKEKILTLLNNFGQSNRELNSTDIEIKNAEYDLDMLNLRIQRDSARTALEICKIHELETYEIDGKKLSKDQFIDTLITETNMLRTQLAESYRREQINLQANRKLRQQMDSVTKALQLRLDNLKKPNP